jgi:hypothetical protein
MDAVQVASAVRAFQQTGAVESIGQARLLCYGCTVEVDAARLIERPQRFSKLLEYVDRYHLIPRPFRRCYRALLAAYFGYDPEDARATDEGRESWRNLRAFLDRRKNWLETAGAAPAWVRVLLDNRNLLTQEPTARYAMATLGGNTAAFDATRVRLCIADDAWLARRLVMAQVHAAVELTDAHFRSVVVRLLVAFAKHPQVLDHGLRRIVDRYAASSTPEVHARLRDFALMHWGDPTLPAYAARWSAVQPASRAMIASWIK